MRPLSTALICSILLIGPSGCGSANYYSTSKVGISSDAPAVASSTSEANEVAANDAEPALSAGESSVAQSKRKIIRTATIDLVVKTNVSYIDAEIKDLMKRHDGYISAYREDRVYGDQLQARWVLRIPSNYFDDIINSIVDLGIPQSRDTTSQDVTEEFIDIERRLANKQRLEERILKLLENNTGNIKDVIEVESQLARVREDIERMEGRIKYLADSIAMSTITVTAIEQENYKPKQAPTFGTRIQDTFGESIGSMLTFVQGVILFLVAVVPWLLVLSIVIGGPIYMWVRRRGSRGLDD